MVRNSEAVRALVQRVSQASVEVAGDRVSEIGPGLLVLVAAGPGDGPEQAAWMAGKIARLRILPDDEGRMNRSVLDTGGEVLAVSQFTLYGDVRRGKRPSFDAAARPEQARNLYEYFVERIRAAGLRCESGRFQETMQVELVNEGPVTILLDSQKTF